MKPPEGQPLSVMPFNHLEITQWLNGVSDAGELVAPSAAASGDIGNDLFGWLYQDLHRIARGHMHKENPGHTLNATALTHEAWFRMSEQTRTRWSSRAHFLAVASTMMRRILVNHARAKQTDKRDAALLSLTAAEHVAAPSPGDDVVAVHEALLEFEAIDARAAQVVELKFFGGMENNEIAEALDISPATVKRDWSLARAWLLRRLSTDATPSAP